MIPDLFAHAAASTAARVPLSSDEAKGAADDECTPDFLGDLLAALTQAAPSHATDGSAVAPPGDVWRAGLTGAAVPAAGPEALAANAEKPSEPPDENEGLVVPVLFGDGTATPAVVVAVDVALSTGPSVPAQEGLAGLPVAVARDREGSNLPRFAGDSAQRMPQGAARPDVGLGSHVKIP
ncbi:MAG: hypothetical protein HY657_16030, partial [Acidobacteria bacterium]|nr:hypothetical protein [Acidobacteriota bacterium]